MLKTRTLFISMVPALLSCLLGAPSAAQEVQKFDVPLSEPGRPLTLRASLLYGSITVEGHDGKDVKIEIVPEKGSRNDERAGGMRVIPNTSQGLVVEEQANVMEVQGNWASKIEHLRIKVPRRTSADLKCTNGGDIRVSGIEGKLELANVNGEIHALDVGGSVVANTTNGDVKVTFTAVDGDSPMSFVTLNGDVDVTFPGPINADLRVDGGQGDVYTDFEFETLPQKPAAQRSRDGGRFRLELSQSVHARVGRGGPELHFKTWNGDIFIRNSRK